MHPAPAVLDRFKSDLDHLIAGVARLGIAVSGGPDSLALLLLAAAARPGMVEAATVDHALRQESRGEAEMVAAVCARLGVPHAILTAQWNEPPKSAVQERARAERYRLLSLWAAERGLDAIVTAHHLDDQAETLLMRLARGAGVRGLAGMWPSSNVPASELPLLRPVLGWRREELGEICAGAGLSPVADPGNLDDRFERVRFRKAIADADWLDPVAVASSASHLRASDAALDWAVGKVWETDVEVRTGTIVYRPGDAPDEIRRRVLSRILRQIATEGDSCELRGTELTNLLKILVAGGQSTLRGVLCKGGEQWSFIPAPNRTRPARNGR